jgi:hypothetical protein
VAVIQANIRVRLRRRLCFVIFIAFPLSYS